MNFSEWVGLGELIVGILGIIVGIIGGKELKEANDIKMQLRDIHSKIEKIELKHSQVAHTINNNGLNLADTEHVATKIVEEKTKYKPNVFVSNEEPQNLKEGDIWINLQD